MLVGGLLRLWRIRTPWHAHNGGRGKAQLTQPIHQGSQHSDINGRPNDLGKLSLKWLTSWGQPFVARDVGGLW